MNALVSANCSIPGRTAAKAALIRRVEAAARANAERQEEPHQRNGHSKAVSPIRPAQPAAALATHILGAREGYANLGGYGAYERAAALLTGANRVVDLKVG